MITNTVAVQNHQVRKRSQFPNPCVYTSRHFPRKLTIRYHVHSKYVGASLWVTPSSSSTSRGDMEIQMRLIKLRKNRHQKLSRKKRKVALCPSRYKKPKFRWQAVIEKRKRKVSHRTQELIMVYRQRKGSKRIRKLTLNLIFSMRTQDPLLVMAEPIKFKIFPPKIISSVCSKISWVWVYLNSKGVLCVQTQQPQQLVRTNPV